MPKGSRKKGKSKGKSRSRKKRAGKSTATPAACSVVAKMQWHDSSSEGSDLFMFSDSDYDDDSDYSDSDSSSFDLFGGMGFGFGFGECPRSSNKRGNAGNGKKTKKQKRSSWAYMDLLRRNDKHSARKTELLEKIIPVSSDDENDGSLSEASYASSGHLNERHRGILTESDDSLADDNPSKAQAMYDKFYKTTGKVEEEMVVERENPKVAKKRHTEQVHRLHVRQSELKNLRPLQQLCLQCVSNNLEYYADKQDPFINLSGDVLEALTKQLEDQDKLMTPQVFPLILTPNCKYIPLNLRKSEARWDDNDNKKEVKNVKATLGDEHLSDMIEKITKNCNLENIEVLELCGTREPYSFERKTKQVGKKPVPSQSSINTLLGKLVNLKELTLAVGNINDQTMDIIGSTCTQLKVLKLMDCLDQVSDKGLSYIGKIDGTHGKCKQLEILVIKNNGRLKITKRGVVSAMFHLPELKLLEQDIGDDLLYKFAEMYGNKRKLKFETFSPLKEFRHRLKNVLNILPQLKSLDTGDFEHYKFDQFYNLPNLNTLIFRDHTPPLKITSLISSYSKKLTELHFILYQGGNIDWSVIGYHCINITIISCQGFGKSPTQKCKYQLNNQHFTKMIEFNYAPCYFVGLGFGDEKKNELGETKLRFFPENVLQCILSSPVLQTFEISKVNISNKMLDNLICKAHTGEKVFSQLENFKMLSCTVNYDKLKDIICLSPKLKNFDCSHWSNKVLCKQMQVEFVKFLRNYNITLEKFTCAYRE